MWNEGVESVDSNEERAAAANNEVPGDAAPQTFTITAENSTPLFPDNLYYNRELDNLLLKSS